MSDLPSNWEQCESEYNKHYDPYDDDFEIEDVDFPCMFCGSHSVAYKSNEWETITICGGCGRER